MRSTAASTALSASRTRLLSSGGSINVSTANGREHWFVERNLSWSGASQKAVPCPNRAAAPRGIGARSSPRVPAGRCRPRISQSPYRRRLRVAGPGRGSKAFQRRRDRPARSRRLLSVACASPPGGRATRFSRVSFRTLEVAIYEARYCGTRRRTRAVASSLVPSPRTPPLLRCRRRSQQSEGRQRRHLRSSTSSPRWTCRTCAP